MKLNILGIGIASAVLWGGAILVTGVANMMWPDYGKACLEVIASIYPGYTGEATIAQIMIGTGYGLVDGIVGGAIFAWVYNMFAD